MVLNEQKFSDFCSELDSLTVLHGPWNTPQTCFGVYVQSMLTVVGHVCMTWLHLITTVDWAKNECLMLAAPVRFSLF